MELDGRDAQLGVGWHHRPSGQGANRHRSILARDWPRELSGDGVEELLEDLRTDGVRLRAGRRHLVPCARLLGWCRSVHRVDEDSGV